MEEVRGSSPLLRTKGKGQAERLVSFLPLVRNKEQSPRIIRRKAYDTGCVVSRQYASIHTRETYTHKGNTL